jgi:hypothetical protein
MNILTVEVIATSNIVNFLPSEIQTKLQVTVAPQVVWRQRKKADFLA